ATVNINNLDRMPAANVKADLKNISLAAVQHTLQAARGRPLEVSSSLNGSTELAWNGNPSNIKARGAFLLRSSTMPISPAGARVLPLDGVLNFTYDNPSGVLGITRSTLRIPSATLTADGQLSKRSKLTIHASTEQLNDLAELASSFRTPN